MSLIAVSVHIDSANPAATRHLRIRVAKPGQITRARLKVEIFEQLVILRKLLELRYATLWVFHVPKDNRFSWTNLLAGRFHRICRERQIVAYADLYPLRYSCRFDSLNTISAFFHDAPGSDRFLLLCDPFKEASEAQQNWMGSSSSLDFFELQIKLLGRGRFAIQNTRLRRPTVKPPRPTIPKLLTWVYVTAGYGFMSAYLRYVNPRLTRAEQDPYYAESVRACRYYGVTRMPVSILEVERYLETMQPRLRRHRDCGGVSRPGLERASRMEALSYDIATDL